MGPGHSPAEEWVGPFPTGGKSCGGTSWIGQRNQASGCAHVQRWLVPVTLAPKQAAALALPGHWEEPVAQLTKRPLLQYFHGRPEPRSRLAWGLHLCRCCWRARCPGESTHLDSR